LMKAYVINAPGAPDVLTLTEKPLPTLQPDEVLVHNRFIGVNFVDTQHRAGLYYPMQFPFIPGVEAAGVVAAIGSDVTDFHIGDRVASAGHMGGIYADYTPIPQKRVVPVPDGLSLEQAAAVLMQGLTAYVLLHDVYPLQADQTVLIHAAAGGVGSLLVQMARYIGATIIGTTSSAQKLDFIRQIGAHHALVSTDASFEQNVLDLTSEGVHVVYDGVGGTLVDPSLNVLRTRGVLVEYGQSGGAPQPIDLARLSGITGSKNRGTLWVTWASASDYLTRTEDLQRCASVVFDLVMQGCVQPHIAAVYPLEEAAAAHRVLESRTTMGKVLLRVESVLGASYA
jgi:NADPH:quinone reductase